MAGEAEPLSIEDLCAACHPDRCCTRFLWVSAGDVERWKAEARQDILSHIRPRIVEGKQIYEVISPGRSCFFLKDGRCSIHGTKPIVCRNFLCLRGLELKARNNW
ncbi:MAG TPA: YkgJ family cysteine cluster protein [Methanocella sp.]|uniref:YkgJ family cysteine cluster protein n=1 Tax=Methanocella sp. TaxID=2052833 RepID=UPI002B650AC6|nr:YkgJ family cysteine cluster protein [Methanocella sp.]HTY91438.1 YkgJ family cysteine cluster protein [Methanocella sp.]